MCPHLYLHTHSQPSPSTSTLTLILNPHPHLHSSACRVLQDVLKVRSRRDAAFDIPDPEDISENPTAVEVERLRREWWPKLEHHAHIVVMNRQYEPGRQPCG